MRGLGDHGGQAKVLDFGLAKLAPNLAQDDATLTALDMTSPGVVLGTVAYMSPEQALGKDLDHRTDIFSFGVVLYEMITARRPFEGHTSAAMFDAILNRAPIAPVELNRDVPLDLERIVNRTLEKDPNLRYQSAADLQADLRLLKRDSTSIAEALSSQKTPKTRSPRKWWLPATIALLAVALVLWATRTWESNARLTPVETKRITFTAGPEFSGSLSPNSEFLAYSHTEHGTMDLFVQSLGGGRRLRLTDGTGDEDLPRWSRDGTRIAYMGGDGTFCDILTISSLGGLPTKLTETRIPFIHSFWTSLSALGAMPWSLNDESLLFSRELDNGDVAVFQVDNESHEERQLSFPPTGGDDLSASWSFDGKWIVFTRAHGGASELWLLPSSGGEARPLLQDGFANMGPAFLPRDQHVIFTSNRSGMENIWGIHIGTGELSQLTTGGGKDWYPSISNIGTIAYTRWDHQTDLHILDTSTGESEQLTAWTSDNFAGRYAPAGDRIAYQSSRTGNSEIWIRYLETGEDLNLSNHSALDVAPAWSPDGNEIAFLSNRNGVMNLWVAKTDGSGSPEIVSDQEIYVPSVVWAVSLSIRWTPDGRSIGYVLPDAGGPFLWTIDRHDSANRKPVLADVLRFDWYLDRHRIVYTTLAKSGLELRAANLETGEEILLYAGPHTEMILSPDGSAIALVQSASHFDQGLFLLELEVPTTEDGLPRALGGLTRITDGQGLWHVHNGSWSPDGKRIVYTQDTDDGDIYLLSIAE